MKLIKRFALIAALGLGLDHGVGMGAAKVVVMVVSTKNPVAALSKSQAEDIFLGRSNRFPDGSSAVPIDQPEGSAARDEFYLKFTGKSPAQIKAHWSKIIFTGRGQPPRELANDDEVRKRIAENPGAIGYIEQEHVDASVKALPAP